MLNNGAGGGARVQLTVEAGAFAEESGRFTAAFRVEQAFFYGARAGVPAPPTPTANAQGQYAMLLSYDSGITRNINGVNYRIGTAFITGEGIVAVAIPANVQLPAATGMPILASQTLNAGMLIRLGAEVADDELVFPLYRIAQARTGVPMQQSLFVSNALQGLARETIWTNGAIPAGMHWLLNNFGERVGTQNLLFGHVSAMTGNTFTIGSDFMGTLYEPTTFTIPGSGLVPIYILADNRQVIPSGAANTLHRFAARYTLTAAEIAAANRNPQHNAARRVYAMMWHAENGEILSMVFVVDYRPDSGRDTAQVDRQFLMAQGSNVNYPLLRALPIYAELYQPLGVASIQWQSAPSENGPWTNIAGATRADFTPPTTAVGTMYYRAVISAPQAHNVYTDVSRVVVEEAGNTVMIISFAVTTVVLLGVVGTVVFLKMRKGGSPA